MTFSKNDNAGSLQQPPARIITVIVLTQFAGTSLWFAGNAILPDLQREWGLGADSLGTVTSAVQLGFILGTLVFAFLSIADRFSPRKVFLVCSLVGGFFNFLIYAFVRDFQNLMVLRFLTGVALSGIYPVGMKIASGWFRQGLGKALGLLVGATVVGTAFPHLVRGLGANIPWQVVMLGVSLTAAIGGVAMYIAVPDGPYHVLGNSFNSRALYQVFRRKDFRAAAFGYFGHMWELYTLWAFVPFLISFNALSRSFENQNVPFWSFLVIAAGGFGCAIGGMLSRRLGSARVAFTQLLFSGLCCISLPLVIQSSTATFLSFLIFWGIVVVGDSPQYSALAARNAPRELVGSALTIMNSIGFALTIASIQTTSGLLHVQSVVPSYVFASLAVGPLIGLISLWPLVKLEYSSS
jgi:predicted MFS family arabinose efflux permease